MKILCIDDSGIFRRTLRKQLQVLGHWDYMEREDARNAAADLGMDPDIGLVICDQHIVSGSGLDLLIWMRNHELERIRKTPFLMVTADSDRELVFRAAQAGAQAVLLKPIALETLNTKLQQVLLPQRELMADTLG